MSELEVERRLTEVEQRSKSNTHRLDELKPIVEEIYAMSMTMMELVHEVKHTNEKVSNIDAKVDRMDGRVDEMEKAPGKRLNSAKDKVIDTVLGVVVGFLAAGIIWAAVQAF